MTEHEREQKRRGRPKGTTKPDKEKGTMVWIPAQFKTAVLAYIEVLKQQNGIKS